MCTARATVWWLPSTDRDLQPTRPHTGLQASSPTLTRKFLASAAAYVGTRTRHTRPQGGHLASHKMQGALSLWGTAHPPARHRRPHPYTPSDAPRRLGLHHSPTMPQGCQPDARKNAQRCAGDRSAVQVPMECTSMDDGMHCISRCIRCRRQRLSVSPRFQR